MIDDLKTALSSVTPLDSFEALVQSAESFEAEENTTEAIRNYLKALEVEPNSPAVNHALGILECQIGKVESALPRFKTAIQFEADNEQYWVTYFDALVAIDDLEAARTALNYGMQYGLQKSTARVLASEHNITIQDDDQATLVRLPKLSPLDVKISKTFKTNSYWGVTHQDQFQELMNQAVELVQPGYHISDNFFTWGRNLSCLEDESFVNAWKKNVLIDSDVGIVWRRYILACSAFHAVQLEGDFVECGVFQGSGVKTVMDYLGGKDFPKTFWAYDTYDYNPVKGHENELQKEGFFQSVLERFEGYKQVNLVKGLIPDVFEEAIPDKIAYLHIDLNNAEAELHSLDYLFDRVVSGGVIVLDDYEWSGIYRAQKQAEDPWFDARGYRVTPLPTGQGIIYKR